MADRTPTRALIVTSCEKGYEGTGAKGDFIIYNIEATTDEGNPVTLKLRSFDDLTPNIGKVAVYEVKPYLAKNGNTTYTLRPQEKLKIEPRVKLLEEELSTVRNALVASLRGDSASALEILGIAPTASSLVAPDDSDVPFLAESVSWARLKHVRHDDLFGA